MARVRDLLPRLITVGALAVAIGTVVSRSAPADRPAPLAALAHEAAPDADNVDPGFHGRQMKLEERVTAAPDDTAGLRELADLLMDAHDPAASVEYRRRYLEHSPSDRQAWLDLASAAAAAGDTDSARQAMLSLIELNADDATALYNLGAIDANAGNRSAARTWWEKAARAADPAIARAAGEALARIGVQ